jgi:hypothetical protein
LKRLGEEVVKVQGLSLLVYLVGETCAYYSYKEGRMLPVFPDFAPIELSHRAEVERSLLPMERSIAELTFSNLYLFRSVHDYKLSSWEGLVLITGRGYDGVPYALGPWGEGSVEEGGELLCELLASQGAEPVLFPVTEEAVKLYFSSDAWQAVGDRDQADYVYCVEELAKLVGKKYQKRRNRLNKFMREHGERYRYIPFSKEHIDECAELARTWCDERCSLERPSTYRETDAAIEAVKLSGELGFRGGVALIDGEVAAFCLGEPLNKETFVVHFEKTLPGMDGLAQALNRDFCVSLDDDYAMLDKEQDLGDPGLRHAKMSYHPVALAQKFRVAPVKPIGS